MGYYWNSGSMILARTNQVPLLLIQPPQYQHKLIKPPCIYIYIRSCPLNVQCSYPANIPLMFYPVGPASRSSLEKDVAARSHPLRRGNLRLGRPAESIDFALSNGGVDGY